MNKKPDQISPRAREVIDQFAVALLQVFAADTQDRIAAVIKMLDGPVVSPRRNGAAARVALGRKKGEKRTPEQIERLTSRLLAYVKAHHGESIEQIGASLGVSTKELTLPMGRLLNAKDVKTKGVKRSMKYFPA